MWRPFMLKLRRTLLAGLWLLVSTPLMATATTDTVTTAMAALPARPMALATFAGGCFWSTESDFEKLPGVLSAVSGYTGGNSPDPSYAQVSSGATGHLEAVQVRYDPMRISYAALLDHFWRNHDYTDARGQFCDRGSPYATAIFTHDTAQAMAAEASRRALQKQVREHIVTRILPAGPFYVAEDYHQNFAVRNGFRYKMYRLACGRDARLRELVEDRR